MKREQVAGFRQEGILKSNAVKGGMFWIWSCTP